MTVRAGHIVHLSKNEFFVEANGFRYRIRVFPPSDAYPRGVVEAHEMPSYLYPVRGHTVCVVDDASAIETVVEAIVEEYAPNRAVYLSRWREKKFAQDILRKHKGG